MKKIIGLLLILVCTACNSDQSEKSINSIFVLKDKQLVKEEFYNGSKKGDLVNIQSVTKSIISLLVGIAIDKGLIKSEEVTIHHYFPEELQSNDQKKKITIAHLLNHTSGLEWNGYLEHENLLKSSAPSKYILQKKMVADPGELYNYNSGGTHLLSIILNKATGQTTKEFAEQHLFQTLHFDPVKWEKLEDGFHDGTGIGLHLNPQDLIKIGQLLLDNGKKDNLQLISSEWIGKSFDQELKSDTKWGLRKSKHGYGWYSKTQGGEQILYSMGYGGQFILIIPSEEIVIVATHNHDTQNGIEQQVDFLKETLPKLLIEFSVKH